MSNNPYGQGNIQGNLPPNPGAKQIVSGAAIALLIVSLISAILLAVFIVFDIFMLGSGMAAKLPENPGAPISREGAIMARIGFAIVLLCIHSFVAWGAFNMKNLQSFSLSRIASIIAVIPCISPCYFLGIPFGIWALISLGKPGVKEAFTS